MRSVNRRAAIFHWGRLIYQYCINLCSEVFAAIGQHLAFYRLFDLVGSAKPILQVDMCARAALFWDLQNSDDGFSCAENLGNVKRKGCML